MVKYEEDYYEEESDEDSSTNIKINLPKPHAGQLLVLESKAKWRILCCGRRWGKSFVCLLLSLEIMFKGKTVAYVTPTFSLGTTFFNEILKFIPDKIIVSANKAELSIKLVTGGEIKFFSGEATRSIRGFKFSRVVIDEAAFIPDLEAIWNQVIMPTLATTNGDAIFVSTPNGREYFHSLYIKGLDNEDNYESFHFPSSSSPFVSQEFLETARKTVSEEVFRQEYLAEPLASTGNPFGDHIRKNVIEELSNEPAAIYAIDIAKYNDFTVIIGLDDDFNMCHFERFKGEWQFTEQKIKSLPPDVTKVLDATGVGDVLAERLAQEIGNIISFKFTAKTKPSIMRELIVAVQQNKIKYNQTTAGEMESFQYKLSASGHPIYEASSGYHDDTISSLAMANHYLKQAVANRDWRLFSV